MESRPTTTVAPGRPAAGWEGAPDGTAPAAPALDILLVEDNAADVMFTRQILRRCRIRTNLSVARDGEEALAVLAVGKRPDLVLLDLNMPRMGGLELLTALKDHPDLVTLPVIVLTSSIDDDDIEQAYRSHANAYVRKPTDLQSLAAVISAIEGFWGTVAVLPPSGRCS
jgi:CheY-like chemotaxis protein